MNSEQHTGFGARISQIYAALLLGFGSIVLVLLFWIVIRGPSILERADNPRQITAELNIRRGQILDARDEPLATTREVEGGLERYYPSGELTGPAVGYYSLRLGLSGVEAAYDEVLRGTEDDVWRDYWQYELLKIQRRGQDVRLTLDKRWQEQASLLLGNEAGAVVLVTVPDADILAMASRPGYDPNRLETTFETLVQSEGAPLLNRATQGQYLPGLSLQPFLLSVAADRDLVDLQQSPAPLVEAQESGQLSRECTAQLVEETTWEQVLVSTCPEVSRELGEFLSLDGVRQALERFQLFSVPAVPIAAESTDSHELNELEKEALGRGSVAVSPLQMALAWVALANDGMVPTPRLVGAIQSDEGGWQPNSIEPGASTAVSAQTAGTIFDALPSRQGILELATQVSTESSGVGPAWYLGMAPTVNPRFAVVALLERQKGTEAVSKIGRELLLKLLNPES
ncbi:MAG: penicillin-binding transpeptidase domain-containing protein [Candidatus Promineifilaceae bacterium]|nr:penicillin-binding transpeptidase domain-containing protein [Candidatus Promineifilaceae bacterium]